MVKKTSRTGLLRKRLLKQTFNACRYRYASLRCRMAYGFLKGRTLEEENAILEMSRCLSWWKAKSFPTIGQWVQHFHSIFFNFPVSELNKALPFWRGWKRWLWQPADADPYDSRPRRAQLRTSQLSLFSTQKAHSALVSWVEFEGRTTNVWRHRALPFVFRVRQKRNTRQFEATSFSERICVIQ